MKTLIAIPCMDTIPVGFMQSILYLQKPEGTFVCFKPNSLVYDSRNMLALTAIEKDVDRILWLDSDMVFTPDTLVKLSHDMDTIPDCEMVTGLYTKRIIPYTPVIYRELNEPDVGPDGQVVGHIHAYEDYPINSIFKVEACGFGCVMTSVSLIRKVIDKFTSAFLPYLWAGEDLSFCYKVKQLGIPIYCDSSIKCGHIGSFVYDPNVLEEKRGDANGTSKAADANG